MAAKKGKALAQGLIDELLHEDDAFNANGDKTEQNIESFPTDLPEPIADFSVSDIANEDTVELQGASAPDPQATTKNPAESDDKTMRLTNEKRATNHQAEAEDRVRASVGRFGAFRSSGPATATEAALAQSESLRIAQSRLLDLEHEIERLRLQNEELAAAGETLRRRSDELLAQNQTREHDYENAIETFEQEKQIMTATKEALQRDVESLRRKNEELELRVTTNIQKIRVRERELENRLELVKMESAALIRSKDEMVLELKRSTDQLNLELNNYRNKNQELNRLTNDKQEMLRRTVKALRLALSMLEGEEELPPTAKPAPQKKAK